MNIKKEIVDYVGVSIYNSIWNSVRNLNICDLTRVWRPAWESFNSPVPLRGSVSDSVGLTIHRNLEREINDYEY